MNQEGKLFDIVGTPNIPKNKGKWEGCTNFIVDENTHELRFIDTITGSKTLLLPESIAHFITKTIPFYKRQKQTMDGLLKALP